MRIVGCHSESGSPRIIDAETGEVVASAHYEGVAVFYHNGTLVGYATEYWLGVLPVNQLFAITPGYRG